MSTAYAFDATIARAPVRRPLSPLRPKVPPPSQRYIKALARIFVVSTAAVSVVATLLLTHIDNPTTNERRCSLAADLHNSLVRLGVPPLAVERDWHTHVLPVRREPTGAAGTAGSSCDRP